MQFFWNVNNEVVSWILWSFTLTQDNPIATDFAIIAFMFAFLAIHFSGKVKTTEVVMVLFFILLSILAFIALSLAEEHVPFHQIATFLYVYSVCLFILLCHMLQTRIARYLTAKRGEKWVKELDYIYLLLGSIGVVGSLNRLDVLERRFTRADVFAPLILATAIVVRLIKTRADIGGWNKPEFDSFGPR